MGQMEGRVGKEGGVGRKGGGGGDAVLCFVLCFAGLRAGQLCTHMAGTHDRSSLCKLGSGRKIN